MDSRLTLAVFLWGALASVAAYPCFKKGGVSNSQWLRIFVCFVLVLAAALPVWRLRSLEYNGEINVDESSILAQAMRYMDDPIPWRSVNGGSGGPLNTWVLFWAPLVGAKLTYLVARVTGLVCTLLTIVGTALGVRELVGSRVALLLTLPMTLLLCGTLNLDFVHFSSEQLPSAILAWAVWLGLRQVRRISTLRAFMLGLLTGALPFTKLQVAPAGVFVFMCAFLIGALSSAPRETKLRAGLLIGLGGLIVPTCILVPVAMCGAWSDFLEFYLMEGLRYKNTLTAATPSALQFLLRGSADFKTYWTSFCGVALVGFIVSLVGSTGEEKKRRMPWMIGVAGFTVYLLLMTHLATRTGMGFPHYLMLLIAPISLWVAACLGDPCSLMDRHREMLDEDLTSRSRVLWLSAAVSGVVFLQSLTFLAEYRAAPQFVRNWGKPEHPLVPLILRFASATDRMFIWGWAPKFHVLTGIPPASRFVSNGLLTGLGDLPELYHRRLKEDLEKSKPRLILDATEEFRWPTWPPGFLAGHQAMPELAEITFRDYRQVQRIEVKPGGQPFIIFEKRDK